MRRLSLILLLALPGAHTRAQPSYPVPHPHPMITEVLFDVPRGLEGDASRDGARDAAGDEFIEIANPYDHPINLRGYILSSRLSAPDADTGKGVRFVFPECELGPHKVAVVFNGRASTFDEPLGTASQPPASPHDRFAGALLFTVANTSATRALRNSGDFILLSAPDFTPLDCIAWGDSSPPPPSTTHRIETVDASITGSVQRLAPDAPMQPHTEIDSRLFSPGEIPQP